MRAHSSAVRLTPIAIPNVNSDTTPVNAMA
jgi:hypothetical protein